jgi:ABC-type Fe3+/spermidine/putrescine transport system ATPase subunit
MTVRPERLRLAAAGAAAAAGSTAWPATVDSVVYLGARRELRVRLADGTIAIAEAANDGQHAWSPGDAVVVWFTAEDAWIIAEATPA